MQTIIEARKNPFKIDWKEIFAYRDLLWTLTWRDIRVQYAQTALGLAWAIINPLLNILLFSFVFGIVAKVDTGNVPHLLFTTVGMCGWTYFSTLMTNASNSIISAQGMVSKIYFPRLIIPLSKAIAAFIDFGISFVILIAMLVYFRFVPSINIVFLPFFIFMTVLSGLAGGIWMSALTIRYRDFQHITPLIIRIGMYATPIAYAASSVPSKYQFLFYLNPVAGIVEGFRWSILGGKAPDPMSYVSYVVVGLLFVSGLFYFNKMERTMADIL